MHVGSAVIQAPQRTGSSATLLQDSVVIVKPDVVLENRFDLFGVCGSPQELLSISEYTQSSTGHAWS